MVVPKGYKSTEVGVIPEDWECAFIDDVLSEISMGPFGSDITVSNFKTSGVPVLNGYNVNSVMLNDVIVNYVTPEKAKSLKKAVARRGDIVVTHRGTIGQIAVIPMSAKYDRYVISQSQFRVSINQTKALSHYIVLYFHTNKGQRYLLDKKGHTGVPALAQPTSNFRKLKFPCPSIPEQAAIVEALTDTDNMIVSLEKLIAKKKAIKQGAMQELLTGKRRLTGFDGKWVEKTLGSIFTFSGGVSASRDQLSDKGYYYLHYGDIHNSSKQYIDTFMDRFLIPKLDIEISKVPSSALLNDGDVVFVDASEDDEGASKHIVIRNKEKASFIAGLHTIVAKPISNDLDNCFKEYCFQMNHIKTQFKYYCAGTKVTGISKMNIEKIKLFYPINTVEQAAIASILSDMDTEIARLEKKLTKYRFIKQGMMHELLTGRIRLV